MAEFTCIPLTEKNILSFDDYIPPEMQYLILSEGTDGFGALEGDLASGALMLRRNAGEEGRDLYQLLWLYVDDQVRQRGAGTLLLQQALGFAEEEKVEVNAPAEGTFVEEPAPQYIGFDEAYIMENRQDSSRMKAVRSALKTYMEMKNALATVPEGKKQYHLEGMINALVDLKVMCRSYSFFRHSFFSYGQTRKREVQKVLRDAEAEMARVQRDYFTFLEQEFRTRAHTDPAVRKRRVASKAALPEIKQGEKSWSKRKLQLDDLNKQVTNADYKIHSVKTYLKMKSSFDLKNSGLEFTEEEKSCWKRSMNTEQRNRRRGRSEEREGSLRRSSLCRDLRTGRKRRGTFIPNFRAS